MFDNTSSIVDRQGICAKAIFDSPGEIVLGSAYLQFASRKDTTFCQKVTRLTGFSIR
jgi:hypothetical protein